MTAIIIIAIIVLWIVFGFFTPRNFGEDKALELLFDKSLPFVFGSFLLGIRLAEHGFLYLTLVFDEGWVAWEKGYVITVAVGVVLIMITELFIRRSIGYFIRDVLTLAAVFSIGYTIMKAIMFLDSVIPFPLNLIFAFLPILEAIVIILWMFSVLLWFIPKGTIAGMNREREARERIAREQASRRRAADSDTNLVEDAVIPAYVTDDDGNQYPIEMRGDYIVIRGSNGEVSTRWEYVKGQPYFDLNGTRFFPH